jgi:hypothetical protein
MKDEIRVGSVVRPVHCDRSRYMGGDFLEWIESNRDSKFVVESKTGGSCRLRKVAFAVTDEFLELI